MRRLGDLIVSPAAFFLFWSVLALTSFAAAGPAYAQDATHGEYIFNAAGCVSCHTDVKNSGAKLAGGREIKTPFGVFYGPNITPDRARGVGAWSEADFIRAMRSGVGPGGVQLFPTFPFISFTYMTDADMRDLWAYLRTVPASDAASKPHDVAFPYSVRIAQMGWKWLNLDAGPFRPDPAKSVEINRGAYLVEAVTHCEECHTPRNRIGGLQRSMKLAGARMEGGSIPNITPDPETGIGKWSDADLTDLLKYGMTPDGDSVGGEMAEVVEGATGKLNDADLKAIIAYLRSIPPVKNAVRKPRE